MLGCYTFVIHKDGSVTHELADSFRYNVLSDKEMADASIHIDDLTEDEITYLRELITEQLAAEHLFKLTNNEETKTYLKIKFNL